MKELAGIFSRYLSLKNSFPFDLYSSSIYELLTGMNSRLWKDLYTNYPDLIKIKADNQTSYSICNENGVMFGFKLICFLSALYKRVLERQVFLAQNVIENFCKMGGDNLEKNKKIIDGLIMSLRHVLKFISGNLIEAFDQIKPEFMNLVHFRQLKGVFEVIFKWFNMEHFREIAMNCFKNEEHPLIEYYESCIELSESQFTRMPAFKIEREKSFLQAFYKKTLNTVKASLENENWIPCDIPYLYLHFLAVLCDYLLPQPQYSKDTNRLTNYLNETINFDEDKEGMDPLNSSPFSLRKEFAREIPIKIMKNEIFIENEKFMLGNSTLNLIKSLFELLQFIEISPINATETVAKIFELIKFYNSYTCQLILGAGAIYFDKLKAISVKVLAFSSLILSFVACISTKIGKKIDKIMPGLTFLESGLKKLSDDIKNYLNEINNKIINILNEKYIELEFFYL